MKGKYYLSLFFILFFLKSYANEKNTDSLYIYEAVKKIKKLSTLKKYDEIIVLSKAIIKRRKNKQKLAKDYYRLGFYFKKNNQIDSVYKYYLKSSEIYIEIKDSINLGKQLLNISSFESEQGLYNKSDSTAISALKLLPKVNTISCKIYNCLAINSKHKKEYKEALDWYDLAIKSAPDSIKKIRYLSNKVNIYKYLKDYDELLLSYKKIQNNIYYDSIPLKLKAKILDNYAFAKFLNNKEVSESDFLKAQLIKQNIRDNYGLIANYTYLSFFLEKRNRSKALSYAYKMYDLAKKMKLPKVRINALDRVIALEQVFKIRKYAKERNKLTDSLQLNKQQSQNKFAKIIYNYENEEKQKLKAEVALEKQKLENLYTIILGVLLIIAFVVYFFYKNQKNKKEKIIEVYKTETRLAKKIHDVIANDVYLVMNKIQKKENSKHSVLVDLEKIYDLTRNISHENSPVLTGDQFEMFLRQLFVEFSRENSRVINKGLKNININALAKEKQIVLYRVLQELLVNKQKHSNSSLAVISFLEKNKTIFIKYKDNGIGTSLKNLKNGIQNMETRIKSIGGFINFESEKGKGFKANIKFKK